MQGDDRRGFEVPGTALTNLTEHPDVESDILSDIELIPLPPVVRPAVLASPSSAADKQSKATFRATGRSVAFAALPSYESSNRRRNSVDRKPVPIKPEHLVRTPTSVSKMRKSATQKYHREKQAELDQTDSEAFLDRIAGTVDSLTSPWEKSESSINSDWVQDSEVQYPGYLKWAKYYWIGITNNEHHKYKYIHFRGELAVLDRKAFAVRTAVYERINETEVAVREKLEQSHEMNGDAGGSGAGKSLDQLQDEANTDFDEIEEALQKELCEVEGPDLQYNDVLEMWRTLDSFLKRYHDLFWFVNCPMKKFLKDYFDKRDRFVNYQSHISLDKMDDEVEMCATTVSELEVMSEYIKMGLDRNDQLLFKAFLVTINILTFLGEYVYRQYLQKHMTDLVNSLSE